MADLEGRVCVITGSASGQGRATAKLFGANGARLVLADWNAELGAAEAQRLQALGYETVFVHTDVSDEASVDNLATAALQRFGHVDVLYNNAGIGASAHARHWMRSMMQSSLADWNSILAINLTSMFLTIRRIAPPMLERKSGSIINISSISGLVANCDSDAYIASKGGIIALTRSLALQFAPSGVRVNCIAPGGVETPMVAAAISALNAEERRKIAPLGRIGRPEEISEMGLFLASDRSSYVTGQIMAVDGGYTAG